MLRGQGVSVNPRLGGHAVWVDAPVSVDTFAGVILVEIRECPCVPEVAARKKPPHPTPHPNLLFTFHFSLFTFHFSLSTFHFPILTFHFSLFTFHFSFLTFHFSLFTFHFSPLGNPGNPAELLVLVSEFQEFCRNY